MKKPIATSVTTIKTKTVGLENVFFIASTFGIIFSTFPHICEICIGSSSALFASPFVVTISPSFSISYNSL